MKPRIIWKPTQTWCDPCSSSGLHIKPDGDREFIERTIERAEAEGFEQVYVYAKRTREQLIEERRAACPDEHGGELEHNALAGHVRLKDGTYVTWGEYECILMQRKSGINGV